MTKEIKDFITKAEVANLPRIFFPGRIIIVNTVVDTNKAITYLAKQNLVGVDTETRPSFKRGKMYKVALLQVSTEDTCFLFRLNRIGLPDSLEHFLMGDTLKVGLSLKDDFSMLQKRTDEMEPRKGNWIELQEYVKRFGIKDLSLQKIYANLFGKKISKAQRLSNWEADVLSDSQQIYAATDAWACVKIYKLLKSLEESGDYKLQITQCEELDDPIE